MSKHLAKVDVPQYLREKRLRKDLKRYGKLRKRAAVGREKAKMLALAFGPRSKILGMLARTAPTVKEPRKGQLTFRLPKCFSLIGDADGTILALSTLAKHMQSRKLSNVFLDFSGVTEYDLGAHAVLDVLVQELTTQARRTGRRIRWRGRFPSDQAHVRFIRAMGVIKRLKIEHEYPNEEVARKIRLFDSRSKHYIRAVRPREADRKSRITQKFADHINDCLGTIQKQLSLEARMRLCNYVAEIIDNAEQHAGMHDWTIQGYLDPTTTIPMCEVVILNFGHSIADTFRALQAGTFAFKQTRQYVDRHARGSFAGRQDDLCTVFALQGNISTKNYAASDTRGNGTVEFIEFFERMHKECAKDATPGAQMVVVSGSTVISFDGRYHMAPHPVTGSNTIAFNTFNDLLMQPDAQYVRVLEHARLPGTVICLKFPLSSAESTVTSQGDQHEGRR